MKKRFLFNGVDAETARTSVGGEYDPVILARTDETKPPLAFCEFAVAGAEVALDLAVRELMPIFRRNGRIHSGSILH